MARKEEFPKLSGLTVWIEQGSDRIEEGARHLKARQLGDDLVNILREENESLIEGHRETLINKD